MRLIAKRECKEAGKKRRILAAFAAANGERVFCVTGYDAEGHRMPGVFTLAEIEELDREAEDKQKAEPSP